MAIFQPFEIFDIFILPILLGVASLAQFSVSKYRNLFKVREQLSPGQRAVQTILFSLTKIVVLALVGIFVGLLSERLYGSGFIENNVPFKGAEYFLLGLVFILLGFIAIIYYHAREVRLSHTSSSSSVSGRIDEHESHERFPVWLRYGWHMPIGSIPLVCVLLGKVLVSDSAVFGMVSLVLYGLGIVVPTVVFMHSNAAQKWCENRLSRARPYFAVSLVIILGFYEVVKSLLIG